MDELFVVYFESLCFMHFFHSHILARPVGIAELIKVAFAITV